MSNICICDTCHDLRTGRLKYSEGGDDKVFVLYLDNQGEVQKNTYSLTVGRPPHFQRKKAIDNVLAAGVHMHLILGTAFDYLSYTPRPDW